MRIAVVGSGGVGGYFGGRLAASGEDVHFLARGAHLAALRERGLRIESPGGSIHLPRVNATDTPADIGPADLVFFTVKLYDTQSALALLPPLIGPQTLVVPFQNGVDSIDVLTRAYGRSQVAGGTAYVAAVIAEPGVIRHTAMNRLIFGPLSGAPPGALPQLLAACRRAGIDAALSERILVDIWAKFVRLSVFSGMTAVTRCPIGPIREDPELRAMSDDALHESIAVARAKQIPLPASTFSEIVAASDALPASARSSMLEDLERGRPLELPWLSGALVRIGEEVGIATPTHRLIVSLLRPHVNGKR
ncbi:MAG TPA: 2-dehydropantoate 2-reductase [Vicinamibacterales bacterium]|jgi:2-dehydropantoate 2-reductase